MPSLHATQLRILRSPIGAIAGVLVLGLLAVAIFAPILWGSRATAFDITALSQGPSARHFLGTDTLGRDIFYRILVATRLSVELSLIATGIGVAIGILLGTAPSVLGRRVGRGITALVNIAVAFPALLLILFFAVIFGVGTHGAVLALGIAMAPFYARLTQTLAASVAGRDFVSAAKVAGVGRWRILLRHIIPNMGEQLLINAMIGAGSTLLAFAGLSYLGIGVQAPRYDWGVLLSQGLAAIYVNPAGALGPAAAVVVGGLAFNLFGEAAAQLVGEQMPFRERGRGIDSMARSEDVVGDSGAPILVVENLRVSFPTRDGWITPVRGINLRLGAGEAVGVVGESGSGKSVTALAVARLLEWPASVTAARLEFQGESLLQNEDRRRRRQLGTSLAMVFQDPMSSLNPALKVGTQLSEIAVEHEGLSRRRAVDRAESRLAAVRIQAPRRRLRQYPHELSGGMRQRVMIAMGLMGTPRLIVADEPTTALDVTVQLQVLRLLNEVRVNEGAAILLISHDISVVAKICDRVVVMYAGRIVEDLPAERLFREARHPYTRALLHAVPDMETDIAYPLAVIPGRPPEPGRFPTGCAFAPRCEFADAACLEDPSLRRLDERHSVACFHPQAGVTTSSASVAAARFSPGDAGEAALGVSDG